MYFCNIFLSVRRDDCWDVVSENKVIVSDVPNCKIEKLNIPKSFHFEFAEQKY